MMLAEEEVVVVVASRSLNWRFPEVHHRLHKLWQELPALARQRDRYLLESASASSCFISPFY